MSAATLLHPSRVRLFKHDAQEIAQVTWLINKTKFYGCYHRDLGQNIEKVEKMNKNY